jgi:hypothetical protein
MDRRGNIVTVIKEALNYLKLMGPNSGGISGPISMNRA